MLDHAVTEAVGCLLVAVGARIQPVAQVVSFRLLAAQAQI